MASYQCMVCGRVSFDHDSYADLGLGIDGAKVCLGRCAAVYTALEALVLIAPEAARLALRRTSEKTGR
jgi:hypothetical protein